MEELVSQTTQGCSWSDKTHIKIYVIWFQDPQQQYKIKGNMHGSI